VSVNALLAAAGPRAARLRRGALLLGPAFVAAAAYLDPGNVATNTAAGARYGYLLVWVIVVANLMAGLVQYLSAKLGLVTGASLPEALRDRMSRPARLAYWVQAELVCVATDLAEVLGGAIALHLLFGLPLLVGGVVTTVVSTLVLAVADRRGQRGFEYVITAMLAVVAVGFLTGLVLRPPDPGATAAGLLPAFTDTGSVLLAAGMLGATVMPHAIYLHSSLARDRHGRPASGPHLRRLLTATKADVSIALLLAGAVNLGLVLLGAAALAGDPRTDTLDDRRGPLRRRPAVLRARVDLGGVLRGRGGHGRVAARARAADGAPRRHRRPRPRGARDRGRPHVGADPVAGRAVVRHPVRPRPAGRAHLPPQRDGRPGERPGRRGGGRARDGRDRRAERRPARPDRHRLTRSARAGAG
jgi:hypothetical protein